MSLTDVVTAITNLTAIPLMVLLLGGGLYLTAKLGFFQFRYFPHIMKETLGNIFKKPDGEGTLTPFQAATSALASTVGAANIVGVPAAIAIGGPGAVFWMWIAALLGMATKYSEIVLGITYRRVNEKGEFVGGSMYYMSDGLGWKKLTAVHTFLAALTIFASLSVQSNSVSGTLNGAFGIPAPYVGIGIAILVLIVTTGGIKFIGSFAEKCVPIMALCYLAVALIVIFANASAIPTAFYQIFRYAFTPISAVGGFAGAGIAAVIRMGVARGLYSNEAGNGSAAIAHSAAITTHASKQGLWGVFEVFLDTIVICTLTALIVLTTGVWNTMDANSAAAMPAAAVSTVFGPAAGGAIVSLIMFIFSFTTILVITFYGEKRVEYLFGSKISGFSRYIYICAIILGSCTSLVFIWSLLDIMFAVIVIPNMAAVLALSGVVKESTTDYFSKEGPRVSMKASARSSKAG